MLRNLDVFHGVWLKEGDVSYNSLKWKCLSHLKKN